MLKKHPLWSDVFWSLSVSNCHPYWSASWCFPWGTGQWYDGLWQGNTQPWKWKNNKPWTLSIWWNKLPCELWLTVGRRFKLVFTVSRWNPRSWASWPLSMLGKEHRSATPQLFPSCWRVSLCTLAWNSQSASVSQALGSWESSRLPEVYEVIVIGFLCCVFCVGCVFSFG